MSDKPKFREAPGGVIVDQRGEEIARVNVDGMKVADSTRTMLVILEALNASATGEARTIELKFEPPAVARIRWA